MRGRMFRQASSHNTRCRLGGRGASSRSLCYVAAGKCNWGMLCFHLQLPEISVGKQPKWLHGCRSSKSRITILAPVKTKRASIAALIVLKFTRATAGPTPNNLLANAIPRGRMLVVEIAPSLTGAGGAGLGMGSVARRFTLRCRF